MINNNISALVVLPQFIQYTKDIFPYISKSLRSLFNWSAISAPKRKIILCIFSGKIKNQTAKIPV